MYINIEIYRGDDNIYITHCPELDLYANGKTQKEAVAKLRRIIDNYFEESDTPEDRISKCEARPKYPPNMIN